MPPDAPRAHRLPLGVTAVMLAELDFDEQVDLCVELGVTHYVYRPRVIPEAQRSEPFTNWGNHRFDLTPTRLVEEGAALRERLESAGLVPFATVPTANSDADDAELKRHFRGASAGGARSVRVAPRAYPGELFDFDAYLEQVLADYHRVSSLAREAGVKAVIEMHTGNAASSAGLARRIVEPFDPAELGLIFDLPNMCREGYLKPSLALSAIAAWVDHVHVGGARVMPGERDEHGCRVRSEGFVSLEDADLNLPEWLGHLDALAARLGRPVPLIIEDFGPGLSSAERLRRCVTTLKALLV